MKNIARTLSKVRVSISYLFFIFHGIVRVMSEILLWVVVVALFVVGLVGIVIPFLPGIGLVFAGVLVYGLATSFAEISVTTVVILGVITVVAWLSNYYGSAIGVKTAGGSRASMIGTVVGGLLGVWAGPIGLLLGIFLGAYAGAVYEGKSLQVAGKVAVASLRGLLGATLMQVAVGVAIIVTFFIAIAV